jgi:hypothetical protein
VDPEKLCTAKSRRRPDPLTPEIGFDGRSGFKMVINTLEEAAAKAEAACCLQCLSLGLSQPCQYGIELEPVSFMIQQAVYLTFIRRNFHDKKTNLLTKPAKRNKS